MQPRGLPTAGLVVTPEQDEEGRDARLGAGVACHQGGLADAVAEEAEEFLLHSAGVGRQRRQCRERDAAQVHGVECHRVAWVMAAVDRAQTDDFARQEEAQHLLAPFGIDHEGLDRARVNRADDAERIAGAEQVGSGRKGPQTPRQTTQLLPGKVRSRPLTGVQQRALDAVVALFRIGHCRERGWNRVG